MKGVANPPSPKKVLARFTIDARLLSSTWLARLLAAATTVPLPSPRAKIAITRPLQLDTTRRVATAATINDSPPQSAVLIPLLSISGPAIKVDLIAQMSCNPAIGGIARREWAEASPAAIQQFRRRRSLSQRERWLICRSWWTSHSYVIPGSPPGFSD